MNLGFKISQGKYICMLSDDCLVVPGAIKNGIAYFEQLVTSGRKIGAMAFYWRDWSTEKTAYHVGCTLGGKMYVNHGLFLNKALQDVGYCDEETFFFYNGDGDLCLKMWYLNYECIDSPDSYIEHYPHANINVRKTNYVKFKQDLKNYLKKWEGIYYDPLVHDVGRQIEKKYNDPYKTVELFLNLHKHIVQANPKIIKPVSGISKLKQYLRWKWQAGVRKVMKFKNLIKFFTRFY
jgi:GT2 family glycosyltransferase